MTDSPDRQPAAVPLASGRDHVARLQEALRSLDVERLQRWGRRLAGVLRDGGRLLAAGNGGSAAEAQHLTSELVGRLRDDREPLSAISLHAETSTLTAIGNDYGYDESFARQVRAHGRAGDILILLSTSGHSRNILRAAEAAQRAGLEVWALTGPGPNPLTGLCDDVVTLDSASTATIQEGHLVAVHLICAAVDIALGVSLPATAQDIGPADTAEGDRTAPLVVIGDALLDRDVVGVVERLSPEAPVPVVDQVEVRSRPGGAGLAAVVAARGTRPVVLVTALATDPAGRELAQLLREHGVQVVDLGLAGPTPVKSRVRADGRSLIMLSQATGRPAPLLRPLSARERTTVLGAAAILVSDYGRGVSEDASVRSAVEAAVSRCPVVWDPHPRGDVPVPGVRLITPNSREAAHFARHVEGSGLRADIDRGLELVRTWSAATVAVTRGADGAVLVDASGTSALVVPCPEVPHGDSAGAGDCFAATAAGLLADGRLVSQAVTRAVAVAAGFVAAGGASSVSDPLPGEGGIRPGADEDALAVVARVRAAGGTVVATGGCFDLLHTGHVALLERARRLGDCLVVCLNDDESVGRLKGPERPVVSAADRAAVLRSLASVDGVVVFPENTPEDALERIRPDIYVKGGDYRIDDVPEAALVEGWGGRTVILPYLDGRSTTNMIDRIARGTSR